MNKYSKIILVGLTFLLFQSLAGACLRPLLGGKEVKEIKKDSRYDKLLKHLVFAALGEEDLLRNPTLRTYSEGRWSEYVPFCQGANCGTAAAALPRSASP
jgi:hypothetical protein